MPTPRSDTAQQKRLERAHRLKAVWETRKSELGLIQRDLAKLLGWETQGAVGHLFSGHTPLTIDLLLDICAILQVSPNQIVPELDTLKNFDLNSDVSYIQSLDLDLLGMCISTIEAAESEQKISLGESTKNKLVEFLYAELSGSNKNRKTAKKMAYRLVSIAESSS